jgi:hypothetical protein
MNKFGLRFDRRKTGPGHPHISGTDKAEVQAMFGHANPVAALVDQKFLKVYTLNGADGSEEWFELGDAGSGDSAELDPLACADEIQNLVQGIV